MNLVSSAKASKTQALTKDLQNRECPGTPHKMVTMHSRGLLRDHTGSPCRATWLTGEIPSAKKVASKWLFCDNPKADALPNLLGMACSTNAQPLAGPMDEALISDLQHFRSRYPFDDDAARPLDSNVHYFAKRCGDRHTTTS